MQGSKINTQASQASHRIRILCADSRALLTLRDLTDRQAAEARLFAPFDRTSALLDSALLRYSREFDECAEDGH